MVTQPSVAAQARRAAQRYERQAPVTNFYPNYGGEARIERIAEIQPVRFQEIIPRYNLSTSATRTQGTGPLLYDLPSGWSTPHADAGRPGSAPPRAGTQPLVAPAATQSAGHSVQPRSMAVRAYLRQIAAGAESNRSEASPHAASAAQNGIARRDVSQSAAAEGATLDILI